MNPYAQRLLANLTRSMPELPEPERARVVRAATRAAPTSLAAMGRLDAVVAYLLGMGSAPRLARPDAGAVAAFVAELAAPDVFTELDRRTLALALDPAVWRWEERGLPWGASVALGERAAALVRGAPEAPRLEGLQGELTRQAAGVELLVLVLRADPGAAEVQGELTSVGRALAGPLDEARAVALSGRRGLLAVARAWALAAPERLAAETARLLQLAGSALAPELAGLLAGLGLEGEAVAAALEAAEAPAGCLAAARGWAAGAALAAAMARGSAGEPALGPRADERPTVGDADARGRGAAGPVAEPRGEVEVQAEPVDEAPSRREARHPVGRPSEGGARGTAVTGAPPRGEAGRPETGPSAAEARREAGTADPDWRDAGSSPASSWGDGAAEPREVADGAASAAGQPAREPGLAAARVEGLARRALAAWLPQVRAGTDSGNDAVEAAALLMGASRVVPPEVEALVAARLAAGPREALADAAVARLPAPEAAALVSRLALAAADIEVGAARGPAVARLLERLPVAAPGAFDLLCHGAQAVRSASATALARFGPEAVAWASGAGAGAKVAGRQAAVALLAGVGSVEAQAILRKWAAADRSAAVREAAADVLRTRGAHTELQRGHPGRWPEEAAAGGSADASAAQASLPNDADASLRGPGEAVSGQGDLRDAAANARGPGAAAMGQGDLRDATANARGPGAAAMGQGDLRDAGPSVFGAVEAAMGQGDLHQLEALDPAARARLDARLAEAARAVAKPVRPWLDEAALPGLEDLAGQALPEGAVRLLLFGAARGKGPEPPLDLALVAAVATPASCVALGSALLELFLSRGPAAPDKFLLPLAVGLGGPRVAAPLAKRALAWPRQRRGKLADFALAALAASAEPFAVLMVDAAARRLRTSYPRQAEVARGALASAVAPPSPTFGLPPGRGLVVQAGAKRLRAGVTSGGQVILQYDEGAGPKSVPKTVPEPTRGQLSALAKYAPDALAALDAWMEDLLLTEAPMDVPTWRATFVQDALRFVFGVRQVWLAEGQGERVAFRALADGSLIGVDDAPVVLPEGAAVRLWHPLHDPGGEGAAWAEHLVRHRLSTWVPQLERPVERPTPERLGSQFERRLAGVKADLFERASAARRLGWRVEGLYAGAAPALKKAFGGVPGPLWATLHVDGMSERAQELAFTDEAGRPVLLGAVPGAVYAQAMGELVRLLGVSR